MRPKHPKPASNLDRGSTVVAPIRVRASLHSTGYEFAECEKGERGRGEAVTELVANRRVRVNVLTEFG